MSQAARLAKGGRINREKPVHFNFNGRRITGYEGDTMASALLANGIHLVARSFKYHRPRGIIGSGTPAVFDTKGPQIPTHKMT